MVGLINCYFDLVEELVAFSKLHAPPILGLYVLIYSIMLEPVLVVVLFLRQMFPNLNKKDIIFRYY